MVDKRYCMSSYLAFRYIEKADMDFYENTHHFNITPLPDEKKHPIKTSDDIGKAIEMTFASVSAETKMGILLSGGMDSAILASYLPKGTDAYTFRFLNGDFQKEELMRAEYYAKYYGLSLHYVDIDWSTVERYLEPILKAKGAPVHSIEPQIFQAALQAKEDGVELMVVGESSDLVFGGMDQLLARDWKFNEFMNRYIFTQPADVLIEYEDMSYLFERYRIYGDMIDFEKFMDEIFSVESSSSYLNAFNAAEMLYIDPYAKMKMVDKLDLYRVRHGESKYLVRELMAKRYPKISVPNKVPMPRPVDLYFADWKGPTRPEFRNDIDIKKYTGNQKWQMYCLERFLNMHEPIK